MDGFWPMLATAVRDPLARARPRRRWDGAVPAAAYGNLRGPLATDDAVRAGVEHLDRRRLPPRESGPKFGRRLRPIDGRRGETGGRPRIGADPANRERQIPLAVHG